MTKTTHEIRQAFLEYFEARDHLISPSSPLTPKDDPTLLFVNAGMAPLKDYFSGARTPPASCMTSAQKCVRAGGKHNDLDNVGYTARHHTFFEMLGNFSFGEYFKEGAIRFAWEFLTSTLALPAERLLVTVFHEDEEAAQLWREIAELPDNRIIRIATDDNFWSMGDTGPCGPCSEIFFDHGSDVPGGPPGSPDEDGDRFVEIWNLVFMQFDRQADGTMVPLPKPCIDTGSGLERLVAAVQGVPSNYDIDLFQYLISASQRVTGEHSYAQLPSHRVIVDHLRTAAFLIAEGVLPSNEGRGYVLRRIMRRAMRHLHLLGTTEPVFARLVQPLVDIMGEHYQALKIEQPRIEHAFAAEEEQFRATLDRGMRILEGEVAALQPGATFSGAVAFKLYDTYGFPLDLTQDVLRGQEIEVDVAAFDEQMDAQRARARQSWAGSGDVRSDPIWSVVHERLGDTPFRGYTELELETEVRSLLRDGREVQQIETGDEAAIVCAESAFYGESGGQVGDQGLLLSSDGCRFVVRDTQKPVAGLIVLLGSLESGRLAVGNSVRQAVDVDARRLAAANHSATHLLHAALRQVLGSHVAQKGSYVGPDRLRFDFSHNAAVGQDDLDRIEQIVNAQVVGNVETGTALMALDRALETGAMAMFDEKYDDEVRVLTMGSEAGRPFSIELCGGTHVARAGDIGLFKIVSEASVGAGVRRIEAVTNEAALRHVRHSEALLRGVQEATRSNRERLLDDIDKLLAERKHLSSEIKALKAGDAFSKLADLKPERINDQRMIAAAIDGPAGRELKDMVRRMLDENRADVICLISESERNAGVVVGVSKAQSGQTPAATLLTSVLDSLGGGGGGGSATLAQGATKAAVGDQARVAAALQQLRNALATCSPA